MIGRPAAVYPAPDFLRCEDVVVVMFRDSRPDKDRRACGSRLFGEEAEQAADHLQQRSRARGLNKATV